jgi:hypothetical protein
MLLLEIGGFLKLAYIAMARLSAPIGKLRVTIE